ncbi:DNA internalization-related competence protein ComEC/Rec2 [Anaeroplasma bactoclasticum]|jgi:competence protein ComEC|nr:DNA internalization-related competence protein ComEC/Rec2 [Anaeroplasma bactoclasticum]
MKNIKIDNHIESYVYDIDSDSSYILFYKGVKIKVNEYNHKNEVGDYIEVDLLFQEIEDKSYDTDFDYKEYLYSKGIYYLAKGKTIEKKGKYFSPYSIKYSYMNYLKEHLSSESFSYVSELVFGEDSLDSNIKDSYSILGISHILAISGLHILFLYKVLAFILLKVFKYYKKAIPLTLLISYTIIIGAPPSALRALLFLVIGALNKKGEVSYTRLDILSISMIFMLLLNPNQLFNTGFLLSYLVSFVLIFMDKGEKRLKGLYKSYYLIYLSTFPLVINMTNKISFLSLLLSPIFALCLPFVLLPSTYILSIFPILDYGLKYIFILINSYLENITSYNLAIAVPSFNIFGILFYYIFFIFLVIAIEKKKKIYFPIAILSIYLISFINLRYVYPFYKITYIDCGQGDSCLIELPYGKGVMLIDAYNSYDYLKSLGINNIDILLFTHSDSDHIGDYKDYLENMNVKKIYAPKTDKVFDDIMPNINLTKIESGNIIYFDSIKIDILGPINSYDDPNSNSIVLTFKIEDTKYMFTGDMTEDEENDLVNKYGVSLDSDILKVAHHGSDTSSSKAFLDMVSPKISIISVAKNNKYGLPKDLTLKRIEEYSKVYITYNRGNITISQGFGKVHISTYR